MERIRLPLEDPRALDLLAAWGVPYSWGGGMPRHGQTDWPDGARGIGGGRGWDCSGFAQACLVRLGMLEANAPDRTAAGLFLIASPVVLGDERLGDMAFYGIAKITHVMVVLAHGVVFGSAGGDSNSNADNPRAFVRLERLHYRADCVGVRRLPPIVEVA